MARPFIAGNWKMNTDAVGAAALASGLVDELAGIGSVDVAVCPPFVYLQAVAAALAGSQIKMGAQDM